jgi:hypothetical protein
MAGYKNLGSKNDAVIVIDPPEGRYFSCSSVIVIGTAVESIP